MDTNTNENKKILIVEDDDILANMYETRFAKEGFMVEKAIDGVMALEKINHSLFDIILLDLMLPKIDGFEVLQKLKNTENSNKNTKVIILTNLGQKGDIERAKILGITEYIVKADTTPNQLAQKVLDYLK
jgi:CheY-like chemotaxis protein